MRIIIPLLIAWNFITFLLFGLDKRRAKNNQWRISERTLLLCALMMGGFGAILGMNVFRHKTKHLKFNIIVPVSVILNLAILAAVYFGKLY